MHWVLAGFNEPLSSIPGHSCVKGIERLSLMKAAQVPGKSFHVAAHVVSAECRGNGDFRYTEPHSHEVDEVNILLSERSTLTYLFEVDGERFTVSSPATVVIPARSMHRMEAVSGEGIFLCMHSDAQDTNG